MLSWVIQVSVISLIIIFLIHHLFTYFKTTLTVPQVKDLINKPTKRYEEILNTLSYKNEEEITTSSNMKDELKNFLEQQFSTPSKTTPIATIDSFSNYSQF
tara:strand:+ start:750 stop:1052 length:303 start_codon:yes stop_codon:yes gene_type:complete